jgi:hypothetical protein
MNFFWSGKRFLHSTDSFHSTDSSAAEDGEFRPAPPIALLLPPLSPVPGRLPAPPPLPPLRPVPGLPDPAVPGLLPAADPDPAPCCAKVVLNGNSAPASIMLAP